MDALFFSVLLLGLAGVVGLVEHSLYGGWNRVYYTYGLPFVVLRMPAPDRAGLPPLDALQGRFRSVWIGVLVFQPLAPQAYGFRREFFHPGLLPGTMTHGVLQYDAAQRCVVVKGFLNAWIALVALAVVIFALLGPLSGWTRLLPLAVIALWVGLPLVLERQRCMQLARLATSAGNESAAHS